MFSCFSCDKFVDIKECFYCNHRALRCTLCFCASNKPIKMVYQCASCCTYVCTDKSCKQKHQKLDCGSCARNPKPPIIPNTEEKFTCKTCDTVICGGCRFKCDNSSDIFCIDCKCPHFCDDECRDTKMYCSPKFSCDICHLEAFHTNYLDGQCCSAAGLCSSSNLKVCCKCMELRKNTLVCLNDIYSCRFCNKTFCNVHKFLVVHKNGKTTDVCKECRNLTSNPY